MPDIDLPLDLPPEVLGEVFIWALPRSSLDMVGRDQLVSLTLVCKEWHRAAHQSHRLWSRVELRSGRPVYYDGLTAWLKNAGCTPKALTLAKYSHYNLYDCPCAGGLTYTLCYLEHAGLAKFLASGPALDQLTIATSPSSCFEHLMRDLDTFKLSSDSLPLSWNSIRSLTLTFGIGFFYEPPRTTGSIFNSLPEALTSLDLKIGKSDGQPSSRYHIPQTTLERLRSFRINCHWQARRLARLIRHCRNVETLYIALQSEMRGSVPPRSHGSETDCDAVYHCDATLFTHLLSLDINILHPEDAACVLSSIRAPNLVEVRIHNDDSRFRNRRVVNDYLGYLNALTPGPFRPPIESLTIYEWYTVEPNQIDTAALIDILSDLPSLMHLRLEEVTFDMPEFLSTLQSTHERVMVVPRLKSMIFVVPGEETSLKDLLAYVKLRDKQSHGHDTLRRIELRNLGTKRPRLLDEYHNPSVAEELRSLGVSLELYR
ncbi:hypothetical protein NMY22_g15896 [Coprinellus aureogranulatus]|nr:hypothetical protein NMY22_g15896 [Coprinellus aureogranulatus]